jgi:hypothetical protein
VDHGVAAVQHGGIELTDVALHQVDLVGHVREARVAEVELVEDAHRLALLEELADGDAANVPGASGDEDHAVRSITQVHSRSRTVAGSFGGRNRMAGAGCVGEGFLAALTLRRGGVSASCGLRCPDSDYSRGEEPLTHATRWRHSRLPAHAIAAVR